MALTINANSLFVKRYLTVRDDYAIFMETAAFGGKNTIYYGQIDYILLSENNELSIQVGQKVFKLPTNPFKPRHQQAVHRLLELTSAAAQRSVGFPVTQPAVRR